MRPSYNGVKYYGKSDLSLAANLKAAEKKLDSFDPEAVFDDINQVLELYNISEVLATGSALKSWNEKTAQEYQSLSAPIMKVVGKYFSKIDEQNYVDAYQKTCHEYSDDFWTLFSKLKVYERVSATALSGFLSSEDSPLLKLLKDKKLVNYYDDVLATAMRESDQTAHVLLHTYLEKGKKLYHIPSSLKPDEYEKIFEKHIASDNVNPKSLELIFDGQSSQHCPLSDSLRLKAKQRYHSFWEKHQNNATVIQHSLEVRFTEQPDPISCEHNGLASIVSHDICWLEENLDFPTILNNFIYVFQMFDSCCRCNLVSNKSMMGVLESAFATQGIKFYPISHAFQNLSQLASAQIRLYLGLLERHDIYLEDVFKWFFEEYLVEEFGAHGFHFNPSSKQATVLEKCKNLASETEGILKQFKMFVSDGCIDQALFEISSNPFLIKDIPSFLSEKYGYANGIEISNCMRSLFSDQSVLSITQKTSDKYATLFDLLQYESVTVADFNEWQQSHINHLLAQKILEISPNGCLRSIKPLSILLKDLYLHDVICLQYYHNQKNTIDTLVSSGHLRIEGSLFSKPEQDYLNFMLNKSEFSNGLDLRNKYAHSTYPRDPAKQQNDYIELLKIMIITITKINEDFCLRSQSGNHAEWEVES